MYTSNSLTAIIVHHKRGSLIETSEDIKELAACLTGRISDAANFPIQ